MTHTGYRAGLNTLRQGFGFFCSEKELFEFKSSLSERDPKSRAS